MFILWLTLWFSLYQPRSKQRDQWPKLSDVRYGGHSPPPKYILCFPFFIVFQPYDTTVELLENPHHLSISLRTSQYQVPWNSLAGQQPAFCTDPEAATDHYMDKVLALLISALVSTKAFGELIAWQESDKMRRDSLRNKELSPSTPGSIMPSGQQH